MAVYKPRWASRYRSCGYFVWYFLVETLMGIIGLTTWFFILRSLSLWN